MTTDAVAHAPPSSEHPWLFGPLPDLLIGCGLAYVPIFLLLLFFGFNIQEAMPLSLIPVLALFISIPHYGSTLLRVYERSEDRRKYQFFTVYLTAAIWLWFVGGVYSAAVGSALVTLYLIWSPWHYMGQNYGVALMFLGRRGIKVEPGLKRLIHWSFLSSFLLTATEMQSLASSSGYFAVLSLEISETVRDGLYLIFATTYIYCTVRAGYALWQRASLKALLPTALLVLSQALWFLVPLLAIRFQAMQGSVALSMDHAVYAFFWIASAHAAQYLWITSYYDRKEQRSARLTGFYGKALAAGALIWVVPALLFAPDLLGTVSYDAGLLFLVSAAVNVHHFMLDGAIWKLRSGGIASILLRDVSSADSIVAQRTEPASLKTAVIAAGVLCVAIHYIGTLSSMRAERWLQVGDRVRAETAVSTLQMLGRDDPYVHVNLAELAAATGDFEAAVEHTGRAIELQPDPAYLDLLEQYRAQAKH